MPTYLPPLTPLSLCLPARLPARKSSPSKNIKCLFSLDYTQYVDKSPPAIHTLGNVAMVSHVLVGENDKL